MTLGIPSGTLCWFDESRETVKIFELPPSEQRSSLEAPGGVDKKGDQLYLDTLGSVSDTGDDDAGLPF